MDKDMFKSYKFKPSDVIEGLNRYFAESKANRYLRVPLEIRNGEVKHGNYYVIRNIVFDVSTPKIKEVGYYCIICDVEEVVGVAINWLREEHDIFYTPGMEVPGETILTPEMKALVVDCNADEVFKSYEKRTLSDRIEELQESRRDYIADLQKNLHDAKRRIVALEAGHAEKTKIIDQQKALIKGLLTNRLLNEQRDFITKVAEILDVKNPYIESEYASAIGKLRTTVTHPNRYKWLYENLKDGVASVLQEAEEKED